MSYNSYSPYNPFAGSMTPTVRVLIIANLVCFIIQSAVDVFTNGLASMLFGLSAVGLKHGFIWQIVTYMFLHGGLIHLLVNMFVLFFAGPPTERTIGTKNFIILYFLSGVLGGLAWLIISKHGLCIGASAAIFGVLGAFATLYPQAEVTMLLFFVMPLTMKAWMMVVGLTIIEIMYFVSDQGGNIANMAHIGGVLVGFLYIKIMQKGLPWRWQMPIFRSRLKLWQPSRGRTSDRNISEIDRILDKISQHGIASLTKAERSELEKASRQGK